MKTLTACILAVILALPGVWSPAPTTSSQGRTVAAAWEQAPVADDWDPAPTDSGYGVGIRLDKTEYRAGDTVIQVELLNYFWDMEPDTVEIVQLSTGKVLFYREALEASLTIDINLHPGEYLLRVRRGIDWSTYWNTHWDMDWTEDWGANWDENWDESSSTSVRFSVVGTADLFHLTGTAQAEKYADTEILLSAKLEWDGPSDGGPYTVTRTEQKYENGEVTYIKDIYDNHVVDEGLLAGGVYTYTVSDGKKTSNPIVIDLSGIPPLEYAGNKNNKVIVLKIGDPYLYSAPDRQSASNPSALTKIGTIDETDLGVVPMIANSRTLLPVATLVRIMSGSEESVRWNPSKRSVTINIWDNTLEIPIGSNTVRLNGQDRTFDTPARIEHDRTLVPIRHLELLGCEVDWIAKSRSVVVYYQGNE